MNYNFKLDSWVYLSEWLYQFLQKYNWSAKAVFLRPLVLIWCGLGDSKVIYFTSPGQTGYHKTKPSSSPRETAPAGRGTCLASVVLCLYLPCRPHVQGEVTNRGSLQKQFGFSAQNSISNTIPVPNFSLTCMTFCLLFL